MASPINDRTDLDAVASDSPVVTDCEPDTTSPPRQSTFFLVGTLASGHTVSLVLRMVGGLLIGRLVAPATLGLFNGIGLVLGYIPFLELGIITGVGRELPYYVGRNERRRAYDLAASAQTWALLIGGAVFLVLSGIAVWELMRGEAWRAAGWFSNGILSFALFYATSYLQATFRTSHEFARLAVFAVIENVVFLALVALVAAFDFYGLCLRAVLTAVFGTILLHLWRPVRVRPQWNPAHLKHLVAVGLPILIVSQIDAWWPVLDSTLVLSLGGTREMGLYSMVLLTTSLMKVLPGTTSQVLYPRMSEEYGRSHALDPLVRLVKKPVALTLGGSIAMALVGWWLVGPVTRLAVPMYSDAVPAMQWALLMGVVFSLSVVQPVFFVLKRQRLYLIAVLTGIGAYLCSLLLLVRGGVSLEAFPQAMLIGRSVFVALSYLFIWRMSREGRRPPPTP